MHLPAQHAEFEKTFHFPGSSYFKIYVSNQMMFWVGFYHLWLGVFQC